ncbi:MAG: hypothetical protein L6Q80_07990 [Dehalococcoidia bacterium]|nr:hypothetical protein [Dehalococcoidia bacterium]
MTLSEFTHRRPVSLALANSAAAGLIAAATGPVGGLLAAVALGGPWALAALARRLA